MVPNRLVFGPPRDGLNHRPERSSSRCTAEAVGIFLDERSPGSLHGHSQGVTDTAFRKPTPDERGHGRKRLPVDADLEWRHGRRAGFYRSSGMRPLVLRQTSPATSDQNRNPASLPFCRQW